jgi:hypothetical protein
MIFDFFVTRPVLRVIRSNKWIDGRKKIMFYLLHFFLLDSIRCVFSLSPFFFVSFVRYMQTPALAYTYRLYFHQMLILIRRLLFFLNHRKNCRWFCMNQKTRKRKLRTKNTEEKERRQNIEMTHGFRVFFSRRFN